MKTNSLLTTILYALLIGLITLAGWKACELKKEKSVQAREQAELSRDLGYVTEGDEPSSTYSDSTLENRTRTDVVAPSTQSGIEGDDTAPSTSTTPAPAKSKKPPVVARTDDDDDAPVVKKSNRVRDLDTDKDRKKYAVIAGSFRVMDNARDLMEELVKKGFRNAEVGKFNRGAFGCAIAVQTDSKKEADQALAKLKAKGYKDAFIKERK